MQWSIAFIVLSIVCIGTIYGQCPSPDVDICQFVTCGNGNCTKDATSSQCFRCQCSAGYTGPLCETEIAAAANCGAPCQNGGRCEQKGPNAYACVCSADFIGVHCETSVISTHICSVAPQAACRNGGTCIMNGDGFLCRCTAGFTGGSCETQINGDNCPINVCLNGGICRINNSVEYCTCPSTFTGETCDIPISTLSTVTPPTGSGACASNPCLNGGLCSNSGNNFVCSCPPTHVGTICETSISTVITSTTRITTTTSGSGQANSCASRPCLNGAQCYNNGNSFFCLCKQGYTGQTCASQLGSTTPSPITPSTISACASNPCNNGGSCYKFEDSFICSCTQYYTGETCDKPKVFTTTAATTPGSTVTCANQPCQNGATCYATGNSYFCFCGSNSMYTGKNCDTPKATADPACPLDCATGYCIRTGATQNGYACMCNGVLTPSSCRK